MTNIPFSLTQLSFFQLSNACMSAYFITSLHPQEKKSWK